jgi:MYXO-CTERM domain-containing protein
MKIKTTAGVIAAFAFAFPVEAFALDINPDKDNTLIESSTGALSNALGDIYVGRTNQSSGSIRRGLVHFDVADNVPACSTIDTATLSLYLNMAPPAGPDPYTYSVFKVVTHDFGEGTSYSGGGVGDTSTPGDATWIHSICSAGTPCSSGTMWSTAGGDFASTASASLSIGKTTGQYYTWSGGTLVNDVQDWLDNPTTNYGWGIMDDAATAQTARRFNSREESSNKPKLTVTYTAHQCLRGNAVDLGKKPSPVVAPHTDPSDELAPPMMSDTHAAEAGGCSASPARAAELGGLGLLAAAAVLAIRRRRHSLSVNVHPSSGPR